MKVIYFVLLSVYPYLSNAQPKVGDAVPSLLLERVHNYRTSTVQLDKLKDKLVILDFWASFCGSCIEAFPEMHHLQAEYKDKLQIFMMNCHPADSLPNVAKFFRRQKAVTGRDFTLPYVLQDTLISRLFPFHEYPQLIWLMNGNLMAITGGEEVTDANIQKMLAGNARLYPKNDGLRYSTDKPLLVNGQGGAPDEFLYRTVITPYRRELGSRIGFVRNADKLATKIFMINFPLHQLLSIAYPEVFENASPTIVNESGTDISERYSYELYLPPTPDSARKTLLREDLARYFHVTAISAPREVNIYTLIKGSAAPRQQPLDPDTLKVKIDDVVRAARNISGRSVYCDKALSSQTVITMPLQYWLLSETQLQTTLQRKGFLLLSERRIIDVPVITRTP